MGDTSTHVIFYHGYWHLCQLEHEHWVDVKDYLNVVCAEKDAEKVIVLP